MFAPLIAKAKAAPARIKTSVPERKAVKPRLVAQVLGQVADVSGRRPTSRSSWNFGSLPLDRPDRPCPARVDAVARDEGAPEEESETPCGDRVSDRLWVADAVVENACTASQDKPCGCAKCSSDEPEAPVPAQTPPPPVHTFTFISRESYGNTRPTITRPACTANADGTTAMSAGTAAPVITVFPQGRYQVRRNDGVQQTATCNRLQAGMDRTRQHEQHHVDGVNNGVAAANTAAGGLPRNFPNAAGCATALTAWNTSVDAAVENERVHGPGTDPPTPQTFTQEHAAGACTFA
jgi:hypothetical protein